MSELLAAGADVLLLDIEGTTTPVDFVFGVLFPFARDRAEAFLRAHGAEPEVQADLAQLRQEHAAETDAACPAWVGDDPLAAVPYLHWLIACDRKSTGLKSLQGKIWDEGYRDGSLKAQVYDDVPRAFERWIAAGKQIRIYSSGSVQAQQLLFRYSEHGDLTPHLSGYYDTRVGGKREADSYRRIVADIGVPAERVLFISDVVAELEAAREAGLQTLFSWRPGNASDDHQGFTRIDGFDRV